MRPSILIRGQWGLGDCIYARPFIRAAASRFDLWLETPWPELFDDLPIRFVRAERALRTQTRNVRAQPAGRWSTPPAGAREVRIGYGSADLERRSIVVTLERQFAGLGVRADPLVFDLPDMGPSPVSTSLPIAVVRPVTVRREWRNEARNPLPEHVAEVAAWLRETHHVVAVADLAVDDEWMLGPAPPAHASFVRGELDVRALLALVAGAAVVTGGVGWIVPATLALGRPAFIVLGGHGAHNAPEIITDPRMDLSRIGFAVPKRYCRCSNMLHRCTKTIPDLRRQFDSWRARAGLLCSDASRGAA